MPLTTRVLLLLVGGAIGFILGYIVRSLRDISKRVEEVDQHVQEKKESHDEGLARGDLINKIALALVILLVAYSSFKSAKAADDSRKTQRTQGAILKTQSDITKQQGVESDCNEKFLAKTIAALNARTKYTQDQADANVDLQKAQALFLGVFFVKPPATEAVKEKALRDYYELLTTFNVVNAKQRGAVADNPYPTEAELKSCLTGKK